MYEMHEMMEKFEKAQFNMGLSFLCNKEIQLVGLYFLHFYRHFIKIYLYASTHVIYARMH